MYMFPIKVEYTLTGSIDYNHPYEKLPDIVKMELELLALKYDLKLEVKIPLEGDNNE